MFDNIKSKFIILISILVITFSMTGCSYGSCVTNMSKEKNTNDTMMMSYSYFKGHKYTTVKLKDGDTLNLNIEVTTEEGNLKVSLLDEEDNELFKTENPNEKITESFKIKKDGTYKIKVEGKHKGSYKITWDIDK